MSKKLTELEKIFSKLKPSTFEEMEKLEKSMAESIARVDKQTKEQVDEMTEAIRHSILSKPLFK